MAVIPLLLALTLSPLMLGIVNRTKAVFSGRQGPPLWQPYFDLWKLLHKGAVYSHTTTWVFRAGPVIVLSATLTAASLVPFGNCSALAAFPGDLILFAYLFGLTRLCMVLAALDTGSAFEGMGSSREVFYSALAEPALLLSLAAVAKEALGKSIAISLNDMHSHISGHLWSEAGLILMFVFVSLFIVLLAENSRIPVDDPTTHLELTMIHEVMILDHSGPDLGFLLYAAALKLWLLSALLVGIIVPVTDLPILDVLISLTCMGVLAIAVGVVESTMARLRLPRVPQLLVGAATLAVLALVLEYRLP